MRRRALEDAVSGDCGAAALGYVDREAARAGAAADCGVTFPIVDLVVLDPRDQRAALDVVPDQLPTEQAASDGQAARVIDVKCVLKVTGIGVPVVFEFRVGDGDRLADVVAGQNPLLIIGKDAVAHNQCGARGGILVPDPSAIPWVLLGVASQDGPGIFDQVTSIQRLNTVGGIAPTTPGAVIGQEARVPYTALYVFYRSPN